MIILKKVMQITTTHFPGLSVFRVISGSPSLQQYLLADELVGHWTMSQTVHTVVHFESRRAIHGPVKLGSRKSAQGRWLC